ncbi:transglutaminase family protein [Andreprevotia chitinilytica]|uniref:transglutaminase family protein n=1 Tax=Andreprevotia chitinilytica TaxID=396808 RepID=UPI0005543E81|nr:transglutaminase family protein [Andreprevotia chitinilytica]
MRLSIHHETVYHYDEPLARSMQLLRLTPRAGVGQTVIDWQISAPGRLTAGFDTYDNPQHLLKLEAWNQEIRIVAEGTVETRYVEARPRDKLPPLCFLRDTPLTECDAALRDFAEGYRQLVTQRGRAALLDLMEDLLDRMPYSPGVTQTETPAAAAFQLAAGVCQDHAHVFLAACRTLGVPARYVSGYLLTDHDEHVASHAWGEAWIEDGWYGFDVSNGCCPDERYVRLAIGLDYLEASPVRGLRQGGGAERLESKALVMHATDQ